MEVLIKSFNDYSTLELYKVMQLRSEVFVVEQDCVYQDLDGKDKEAMHILGYKDQELAAYTRIFKPGDYFEKASIGRVVVSPKMRGLAYGQKIMNASINYCKDQGYAAIQISAQCYLHKFYTDLGFNSHGEKYLEDGIPHQMMIYTF
ncbi:GNAT family N-acetyltransferase [uncultured Nonlabens sp.]|uniref:GNAT family N-acetyltransferase n=1 Tax=uncultured Nonlabens sp. TaxID=859306 RepID=UPI0026052644|nr:GNAT family N-acetyltransferase [uncultured Nonlabens sp.]